CPGDWGTYFAGTGRKARRRRFLLDKGKPSGVVFTLMAFGTFEDHHHTRVPAHRLVETRARLDVFQLNRYGAFVERAVTELRWGDSGLPARQTHTEYFGQREPCPGDVGRAGAAMV